MMGQLSSVPSTLRILSLTIALALHVFFKYANDSPALPRIKLRPSGHAQAVEAAALAKCERRQACIKWHTSTAIRKSNMSIILVGNDAIQQFPLTGYGGIETSVEKIAGGLHAFGIPFAVIVPKRESPPDYPFPIYDTNVFTNGKANINEAFRSEVDLIISGYHPQVGSIGHGPFMVWGQSHWSQSFGLAKGAVLAITSHHDGGGPPVKAGGDEWDRRYEQVRHRFLSHDQRSRWVAQTDLRFSSTRVIPHGLPPEDFFTCPDQGYFLWVATLNWGWEQKGMAIFVELARRRPDLKFIAYGSAGPRTDLAERAKAIDAELDNFEYRGPLKRGEEHRQAFCGATAFLMPTQPDIGESFGMTVIESLSKGVPVIASTAAAVPELLGIPFGQPRRAATSVGSACETIEDYVAALDKWGKRTPQESARIQEWARERYAISAVVDELLDFSLDTAEQLGYL